MLIKENQFGGWKIKGKWKLFQFPFLFPDTILMFGCTPFKRTGSLFLMNRNENSEKHVSSLEDFLILTLENRYYFFLISFIGISKQFRLNHKNFKCKKCNAFHIY